MSTTATTHPETRAHLAASMAFQAPPAIPVDIDTLRTEIPEAMQAARRWLVWKAIPQPGKKPRKVPYYCDGTERRGTLDTPEDQARLGTFADMLAALATGQYAGPGFALGPDGTGKHWQGIDLDHIDTRPELAALVEQLPGYVEWSPSGTGVHALGYGPGFQALGSNASGIEAYASGRFFTVTAEAISGDIEDIAGYVSGTLAPLHRTAKAPGQHDTPVESVTSGQVAELRSALLHMRADDRDLWVRMGHALKGLGDTGRGLWLDWSATSDKFDSKDAARTWESFKPERTGHAAVFAEAQRQGWTNPKTKHANPYPKSEVSGVSGVQASTGAGFSDTPDGYQEVSGVSATPASPIPAPPERPTFRVFNDWIEHGGTKYRPGVWHFGTDKDGNETQAWICSPLYLEAVTFDGQDNNFGRLLRFRNSLRRWREWAMPMELLSGLGNEIRAELLAMGVEIDPSTKARNLLATYLQDRPPKRRMRCALQVGWCGTSFVLPDTVIGPDATGVIFQSGERGHDEYTQAGTLDGWREGIAARAVGNPVLAMAVAGSFVGPLLARCNAESGGIHWNGDSSIGKTAIIEGACATWGGPGYRRSWRATANGMEGAASLFNDCLLAVDEISECDPKEVGAIVYALGNGRGKQRASRTGAARGVTRWRCFIVSSGERTIATTMQEGGYRAKAGQGVRLLDVPAARTFGAWDTLHGLPSGAALSDAIKRTAGSHYGHAGRAFLERLTRDDRDFCALLERVKALPEFSAEDGEGQDKRAAGRFALAAMAGELATEYQITGWPEGEAIRAAGVVFASWRATRGKGNTERRQILERVSGFIERHGDARFSNADPGSVGPVTRDRAGWWTDSEGERIYLFTGEGMREALKGFDFGRALDVLQDAGVLPAPGSDGKRASFRRIHGRGVKVYHIRFDALGDDHGA